MEITQKLIPFNHFIHLISRTRIGRIQHLVVIKDKTNQHQDTLPKQVFWVHRKAHAMQCNTISAARVRCRPINLGCHKRIYWVLAKLCVPQRVCREYAIFHIHLTYSIWYSIKDSEAETVIVPSYFWTKVASSDKEAYYRFSSNGRGWNFSNVHSTSQCWKLDKVNVYVQRFLKL